MRVQECGNVYVCLLSGCTLFCRSESFDVCSLSGCTLFCRFNSPL